MNKADLFILIVILIFMLMGYYKGLIKSILSVIQYFVVTILSIMLAPQVSKIFIEKLNLDLVIIEWAKNNEKLFPANLEIISDSILKNFAGRIINILSVIVLFIVLRLVFAIVIMILNKVANLPILGVVNKLGGLLIGAVNGIIVVYLLILLINWLPFANFDEARTLVKASCLGTTINVFVPEVASEVIELVKISV